MSEHIESASCECEPKVVSHAGHEIVLHRPFPNPGRLGSRDGLGGLPKGWIIVGRNPGSEVISAAKVRSDRADIEAADARARRIARAEAREQARRGLA